MALSPQERSRRMRLNMLMAMSYAVAGRSAWTPSNLFAAGEQGAWYDPSDFSTMFQDSAGTTPVTAVEQPVGLIRDKSGRGNHASQTTSTSRPVLSARVNLLTYTEQFDNAAWAKTNASVTANQVSAPDGSLTADLLQFSATGGRIGQVITLTSGLSFTFSVWIRVASGTRDYQITDNAATPAVLGTITATTTWQRLSVTFTGTGQGALRIVDNNASGFVDTYIWGADLRPSNQSSLPYQRVGAATAGTSSAAGTGDYDTTGFPYYLSFDGTDDFLVTGSIDPGACDKIQAFAGIRKLSDATQAMLFETSTSSTAVSGATFMLAPANGATADYSFRSKGTAAGTTTSAASFAAPITNVLSGLGDISGDTATLRVNGVQVSQATTDQGTGNFLSYPLYIGRRGGSSLPFNGRLFGLIVRFSAANLSSETITKAETWMNTKTGAY